MATPFTSFMADGELPPPALNPARDSNESSGTEWYDSSWVRTCTFVLFVYAAVSLLALVWYYCLRPYQNEARDRIRLPGQARSSSSEEDEGARYQSPRRIDEGLNTQTPGGWYAADEQRRAQQQQRQLQGRLSEYFGGNGRDRTG